MMDCTDFQKFTEIEQLGMSLDEFKSWLKGFNEGRDGQPPTLEQWHMILKKLDEVRGAETKIIPAPYPVHPGPSLPQYPVYPQPTWVPHTEPYVAPNTDPYYVGDPISNPFITTCISHSTGSNTIQ